MVEHDRSCQTNRRTRTDRSHPMHTITSVKPAADDVANAEAVSPPHGRLRLVGGQACAATVDTQEAGLLRAAEDYERFYAPITGRLVEPLLDAAAVGPGTRVLDVATGAGCLAAGAARRGASVIGIDIDESMVQLARRRHPELDVRQADAEALPFEDRSFDAVIGNFLVHHLPSPSDAIAEFVRVLAPGGLLALTAWDVPARTRFVGVFLEAIAESGSSRSERTTPRPDFFRYSADPAFAGLLSGRGLQEIAVKTTRFEHSVPSTSTLWDGLFAGTDGSSAGLILHQPQDVQREIRMAFERRASHYWTGERLELPVSAKVASGRRLAA
jgi:ubiquinone/menaquinone biosynthesis C-methylase UbiE